MADDFHVYWRQAPYALPVGICAAVLLLGWQNAWDATVTVLRMMATVAVDYLVDPLRRYFRVFFDLVEYYVLQRLIYEPLVYFGLLRGVEFLHFARVVYVCIALWFLILSITRLPKWRHVFFAYGHHRRVRKICLTAPLALLFFVCLCGGATLYHDGYTMQSAVVESVAFALGFLTIWLHANYPYTQDDVDLENWWARVSANRVMVHAHRFGASAAPLIDASKTAETRDERAAPPDSAEEPSIPGRRSARTKIVP